MVEADTSRHSQPHKPKMSSVESNLLDLGSACCHVRSKASSEVLSADERGITRTHAASYFRTFHLPLLSTLLSQFRSSARARLTLIHEGHRLRSIHVPGVHLFDMEAVPANDFGNIAIEMTAA